MQTIIGWLSMRVLMLSSSLRRRDAGWARGKGIITFWHLACQEESCFPSDGRLRNFRIFTDFSSLRLMRAGVRGSVFVPRGVGRRFRGTKTEPRTPARELLTLKGHAGEVIVSWSPDGARLAT